MILKAKTSDAKDLLPLLLMLAMKIIYKRVVDQVMSKYGQIDILVNSTVVQHYSTTLEKAWLGCLEPTFMGLFEAHKRRKLFYPNDHGVSAGLLDYSSTKSAIVSLTRALALKLINEGIGVNAEAPGPLWTPLQLAFAC
ncbi:hypothetical protein NC653_030851 [Populus alba x Populus x berolinensis]|uniref:Uncharacterized protein n=1 Tax=Populus alba x Populus x berolinensis TaxID=444605 RepID=A0AAD6LWY6_9ROSI|nr:hypothetical protein NC653_030851 [Populus alba x Populus x berolinensis]